MTSPRSTSWPDMRKSVLAELIAPTLRRKGDLSATT